MYIVVVFLANDDACIRANNTLLTD